MIVNCSMFEEQICSSGIKHSRVFISGNTLSLRLGAMIRKMIPEFNINHQVLLCEDKTLIIFDGGVTDGRALSYIAQHCKASRVIFYYWNPVACSLPVSQVPSDVEKWSYSPYDCDRYGLKYNSTFYFTEFENVKGGKIEHDICFIGKDKGRYGSLMEYKNMFVMEGLNTDFYITATHPKIDHSKPRTLPYVGSVKRMLQSSAIFDYYADPIAGLSVRVMEGLFFQKKIITNNTTMNKYDIYSENNIYVIGEDDNKRSIKEFIQMPYKPLSNELVSKYRFQNWLERFSN